jgi:hypothetical protein
MDIFFIELLVHIYYHGFPFLTSKGIFFKKKIKDKSTVVLFKKNK